MTELTLEKHAEPCPECGSTGGLAMVDVVDRETWEPKGVAVKCFPCDLRSTTEEDMHHAVQSWNASI